MSPQIEGILGFTPVQWCAQPRRWAEQLHPDDVERVIAEEIAAAGDEDEETSATEYRLRHRDGRVVWMRDDAQLLIADDGSRRWHGVLADITERKRAEAELELRAAQQTWPRWASTPWRAPARPSSARRRSKPGCGCSASRSPP